MAITEDEYAELMGFSSKSFEGKQWVPFEGFDRVRQALRIVLKPMLEKKPVLHEDGSLHEFVLPDPANDKRYFRCVCGCNVFHQMEGEPDRYYCNACPETYSVTR